MTSRRQMLKSSLALAAGAVGFGAARKAMGGADSPATNPVPNARPPGTLSLAGRNVHAIALGRPLGQGPAAGDRTTMTGELFGADGTTIGRFLGTSTTFEPGAAGSPGQAIESHTFQLADGTLHGMGAAGDSEFAIVGGTGRYLGARGSYLARHTPIELGGDGSAAFTMTFSR